MSIFFLEIIKIFHDFLKTEMVIEMKDPRSKAMQAIVFRKPAATAKCDVQRRLYLCHLLLVLVWWFGNRGAQQIFIAGRLLPVSRSAKWGHAKHFGFKTPCHLLHSQMIPCHTVAVE